MRYMLRDAACRFRKVRCKRCVLLAAGTPRHVRDTLFADGVERL
jgi:hypothetical protein